MSQRTRPVRRRRQVRATGQDDELHPFAFPVPRSSPRTIQALGLPGPPSREPAGHRCQQLHQSRKTKAPGSQQQAAPQATAPRTIPARSSRPARSDVLSPDRPAPQGCHGTSPEKTSEDPELTLIDKVEPGGPNTRPDRALVRPRGRSPAERIRLQRLLAQLIDSQKVISIRPAAGAGPVARSSRRPPWGWTFRPPPDGLQCSYRTSPWGLRHNPGRQVPQQGVAQASLGALGMPGRRGLGGTSECRHPGPAGARHRRDSGLGRQR